MSETNPSQQLTSNLKRGFRPMLTAHATQTLYAHCMGVYNGTEDITILADYLRAIFGLWIDQSKPLIQLCQST